MKALIWWYRKIIRKDGWNPKGSGNKRARLSKSIWLYFDSISLKKTKTKVRLRTHLCKYRGISCLTQEDRSFI